MPPGFPPARRVRRIGLALAGIVALAACAPPPTPTPAPAASPAPAAAQIAEPTPDPTAEPAASTTATIGAAAPPSPPADRLAAGVLGSRVCVINGAGASMDATATANEVVDLGDPGSAGVVESVTIPAGGSWCTHGYNECTRADRDYVVDVCGFITLPDGRSVAYWAFNGWLNRPYLLFDGGAGAQVAQRWSVGDRASLVTGGYTVTGERLGDAPSDKLFHLTITTSG